MKILFICGSPRKNGNTARIIYQLISKLQYRDDNMEICYITDYRINGCMGCNKCQKVFNTIGCVQTDEALLLLNKIIDADIVFYATPLYGHSYSGQLKLLLDRHVALFKFTDGADKAVEEMKITSFMENKPVGLIVSCQGPKKNNTELVQMQFDKFCESSLATCLGKYIFPFCSTFAENTSLSPDCLTKIMEDIQHKMQI